MLLLSQTARGCCAALLATTPAAQIACGWRAGRLLLPLVCWEPNVTLDGARDEAEEPKLAVVKGQTAEAARANLSLLLRGLLVCGGEKCDASWLDAQLRAMAGTGTRLLLFNLAKRRSAAGLVGRNEAELELQWKPEHQDLTLRTNHCGWRRPGPPSTELPPPTAYSARALLARLWYVPRLAVTLCGGAVNARPARHELRAGTDTEVPLPVAGQGFGAAASRCC